MVLTQMCLRPACRPLSAEPCQMPSLPAFSTLWSQLRMKTPAPICTMTLPSTIRAPSLLLVTFSGSSIHSNRPCSSPASCKSRIFCFDHSAELVNCRHLLSVHVKISRKPPQKHGNQQSVIKINRHRTQPCNGHIEITNIVQNRPSALELN